MTTPPEGFRHHARVEIRFADLDSMGHVNNAKYLTYMETARTHYVRDLQLWDALDTRVGPIMARVTIDYKLPLNLKDGTVDVYTRCTRLGNKSFDIEHHILCNRGGQTLTAAVGILVVVAYDYRSGQPVAVPDDWREKLTAYEHGIKNL